MLISFAAVAGGTRVLLLTGLDGYFESGTDLVSVESSSVVATRQQIDRVRGLGGGNADVRVRVRAASRDSTHAVFLGTASRTAMSAYLDDRQYDTAYNISVDPTEITVITCSCVGSLHPDPPTEERFWESAVFGTGPQELVWSPKSDDELLVIMNADGSPNLQTDVSVGLKITALHLLAIAGVAVGVLLNVAAGVLLLTGRRARPADEP